MVNNAISKVDEKNIITKSGANLSLASAISSRSGDGVELAVIAHLRNKYEVLAEKYFVSPEDREIIDCLSFVESDEEFANGSDPIIGRTLGFIYDKPKLSLRLPHSKEDYEKLEELKRDYPEYYLSLIRVKEAYKGLGMGSAMLDYVKYSIAKKWASEKKKFGFIEGNFNPLDESKYAETERFYRKNGFDIYDTELFQQINVEKTLDELAPYFEK